MTIDQYTASLQQRYKLGNATEHSFRGDLQQLIESLVPDIRATNEPKRQTCGAPDYILTKKDIPLGFIEAKDIGDKDLDGLKKTGNKVQFDRYKASLSNLIFTDYLHFHLYRDGQFITKIAIAEIQKGAIVPLPANHDAFANLIKDFCTYIWQTIKSPKKLAEMMAGKARLLSDVIEKALTSDEINNENSTLKDQMNAFKEILIHDITPKGFADVYAQTIAYGMFAARLHDPTLPTFSRHEASELIPRSNPFLRKLFGYIAGPDLDDRIKWIVDSLVEIFLACNVEEILKNYGKQFSSPSGGGREGADPIIHFYETFLREYDPALRKARGVWYTPLPVVNFIVRVVDDILKTEFNLPQGLADTGKTKVKVNLQETDKRYKDNIKTAEEEVHRVQILDPATGTGTFLAEVIKQIHKKFDGQQGLWSNYVENHLLPRLNGFELLMASYAMAHLQLDLLLTETGYKPTRDQRLKVFLTNSLEEAHPATGTLFANWLSTEANEANKIKRDTPVMCVIGNPPYSVSSSNKSKWIEKLIGAYKEGLTERNVQPLSDDYIKFIRFGQYFIDKNGTGVLAYISNNSFIDGMSHRQMRKHLLQGFDHIYILDLHGNAKKKEVNNDGSLDQNVFDIMQGVSINVFIKTDKKNKNDYGTVRHLDLRGKREDKYLRLIESSIYDMEWSKLQPTHPNFFFVTKDFSAELLYTGFNLADLFLINGAGVQTKRDNLFVDFNKEKLEQRIRRLLNNELSVQEKKDLNIQNSSSYRLTEKISAIKFNDQFFRRLNYRVFDDRTIYYDRHLLGRAFYKVMHNMLDNNIGLIVCKQQSTFHFQHCFITRNLTDHNSISLQTKEASFLFPLYLYPENNNQQTTDETPPRTPNLNTTIVNKIAERLGLTFTKEKETTENTFAPIDFLDYIYAVLHSPTYREKYKEFLKIDFPRVPYPKAPSPSERAGGEAFWQLVKLGGELRQIHLLESPVVESYITQYPIDGNNTISKVKYEAGNVYINDTQYFADVPTAAWNFYIGGYQPAQKWLKDRKGRKLEFEDILHYQKIIVALTETNRLMKEIDKVEIE